jgi:hypothetical protein
LLIPAGETPESAPEAFLRVGFPAFLGVFTARGAYCDFLRGEGQQGKALAEGQAPWEALAEEVDKLELQRGRARRWRFMR